MYDKRIFSDNLQFYMKKHGENQADVARILGISKSNVSAYINGEQVPRMDKIAILCNHYGVNVSDLLERKKAAPDESRAEHELLEIFKQLDEEGKHLALMMLKALLTEHAKKNHTAIVNEVTA